MKLLRNLAVLAGLAVASGAYAQTPVTYVQGGTPLFTIEVPDFWSVRTGGLREITDEALGETRRVNRVIGIRPENDEGAWMGFVSPPGVTNFEEGRAYLREIGKFLVSDAEVKSEDAWRVGGRAAELIQGSGKRDGRVVSFAVALIDLPGDRIAVAIGTVSGADGKAFVGDINDVFMSFRAGR